MALPIQTIRMSVFGSGNWSDQPDSLVGRAFEQVQGGFVQRNPVESPNLLNMDYYRQAIGKRLGSAALDDYSSVLISGDSIIKQDAWYPPGSNTEHQVAAGAKGIYYDAGTGTWARLNNANGTAFQWNTDSTKISFVPIDNHLIIMSDKNFSQVYRSGTALDNQMHNDTTSTTVDASSSSGQKVLNVSATTMFNVGDRIVIDSAGTPENGYVASIIVGVSITLEDNLGSTYTNETVAVANLYVESKGGATQTYTGTWTSGNHIGFELHERFCMGTGTNVWEYTDVQEAYDLAGGSFRLAKGNIVAAIVFTPAGGSELNTVGFLSTTEGPEIYPGFDPTDTFKPMQGGTTALNHQCIAVIDNWVVYFTREGGWEGVNYNETIDLGRRLKSVNDTTGPLDTFTATNSNHATLPFVYKKLNKKQLFCQYPDASNTINTHEVGLDFYLGEPKAGEPQEVFETRVRCLYSSIKEPLTNPWFRTAYSKRGSVVGVLATGKTYTLDSGDNDLGALPVLELWEMPDFDGGAQERLKNWRGLLPIFKENGDWNVNVKKYLDLSPNNTGDDLTYLQVSAGTALWNNASWNEFNWAGAGIADTAQYIDLWSKYIRLRFFNQNTSEPWIMQGIAMEYQIGARSN